MNQLLHTIKQTKTNDRWFLSTYKMGCLPKRYIFKYRVASTFIKRKQMVRCEHSYKHTKPRNTYIDVYIHQGTAYP